GDDGGAAGAGAGHDALGLLTAREQARTLREPARVGGGVLDEERAVEPVWATDPPHCHACRPGQPAISTRTRRPSRAELARTTVRRARTIRPPRPITLPTSSGATYRWRTSASSRSSLSTCTAPGSSTSSRARYARRTPAPTKC